MAPLESHNQDARNRELAELTILEIAKQSSGDEITGKIRLFKAFYFTHLFFACDFPGLLTEWPIVRMPHGPGIEDFDQLIDRLVKHGALETADVKVGPYPSTRYRATGQAPPYDPLSPDALSAIRTAIEFVANKTGAQLSDLTHEFSISWMEANDGEELSIYKDLQDTEEHAELKAAVDELDSELDRAWG